MDQQPNARADFRPVVFSDQQEPTGWTTATLNYKENGNALQTLQCWVPSSSGTSVAAGTSLSGRKGLWIIFIHGGAWRDPFITSQAFEPAVQHMVSKHSLSRVAGMASLNYSLSPYPDHPDSPCPPKDPDAKPDPSRMAVHPAHILDVLTALDFLQQKAGFGSNYVLIGHSAGATMAFQAVMASSAWRRQSESKAFQAPKVILGLNGLYDLPQLVKNPGPECEQWTSIYEAFVKGAFGDDDLEWNIASPASNQHWDQDWEIGVKAILARSPDDTLVPVNQTPLMLDSLARSKSSQLQISQAKIRGGHDNIWVDGERLAEIIAEIVLAFKLEA